ncbi:Protein of unknown function [Pyronema omphalodes CBS 100304]|uniref:Uncharacterized protein n=1 Tax=Pyronema omphalodes (strain CBS 100304) TaxID=1076935 RepID=U4L5P9_PYROM|nr:Protein of unknown function [Pyronema omphalodes CBS 100304]
MHFYSPPLLLAFTSLTVSQTAQPFNSYDCAPNTGWTQYSVRDCTNIGGRAYSINLVRKQGDSNMVTCSVYSSNGCQGNHQGLGIWKGVNSGCTYVAGGFQSMRCYFGC